MGIYPPGKYPATVHVKDTALAWVFILPENTQPLSMLKTLRLHGYLSGIQAFAKVGRIFFKAIAFFFS
jgi:hypothetical protein